jgi:hypothetical protein
MNFIYRNNMLNTNDNNLRARFIRIDHEGNLNNTNVN